MAFAGVPKYELDLKIGRLSTKIEVLQAELCDATTPAKRLAIQNKLTAGMAERAQLLQVVTQCWAQQGGSVTRLHRN